MVKRNQSALGIDLSDKTANYCLLRADESPAVEGKVALTHAKLAELWRTHASDVDVIVMEAGTPSAWVCELFQALGSRVIVADPRKLRAVTDSVRKSDERDAEMLARLGLADESLLSSTHVRSPDMRRAMRLLKLRHQQVRARTATILEIRSQVKLTGSRLPRRDAAVFHQLESEVPEELREDLAPLFVTLRALDATIKQYDVAIERMGRELPSVALLDAVDGVGPITALAFVAVIGDPERFPKTRDVGAYLGLVPRRDQSGQSDPSRRITKAGNGFLRQLLVQCAHRLCRADAGPDTALRRRATAHAERVGKSGKRRVVVAVARKLAVTLLAIWKSGAAYEPLHRVAATPAEGAPQPVVPASAPERCGASKRGSQTAPPASTRTQDCTGGASPTKSADGSAGRTGASSRRPSTRPTADDLARGSAPARPATPSSSAAPTRAGEPAGLASASAASPRDDRGRFAAKKVAMTT